ncbi:biotin carboxylase N-terminal domain-containing protein [Fodinibius sp.]|uniref:biotin carboxylase N-terminal domain-containing protein n=1 Tax=Fodinibius sp. TaxID=1872440 RepID=UPI003A1035DC
MPGKSPQTATRCAPIWTPPPLSRRPRPAAAIACRPGYGFLAENAAFAERCAAAGLTLVGPPPAVLALFGDNARARGLAQYAGHSGDPGSREPLDSPEGHGPGRRDRLSGDAESSGRGRRARHAPGVRR